MCVRDNTWQCVIVHVRDSRCALQYVTIRDSTVPVCDSTWQYVAVSVLESSWQYVTLRFIPFLLIKNTMWFIQLRGQGPQRILSLVFTVQYAAHSVEITEFLFLRVYGWVHEQIVVIWVRLSEINLHLLCHLSDEFFKGDNGMGCNIVCLIPIGCSFFNYSNYHIGSIFYVCYWFCYLSVRKRWTIIYQKFVEYHSLLQVSLENKKER